MYNTKYEQCSRAFFFQFLKDKGFDWYFCNNCTKVEYKNADREEKGYCFQYQKVTEGDIVGYNQALSAYRETRVRTASQGTLIVMLYDEAIKQIGEAIALMDADFKKELSRIEKCNSHIIKSQEIITELMASLNMEAGGEIAKNLLSLYTYFNEQLLEANVDKQPDKIIIVRDLMEQLRAVWNEIITSNAAPSEVQSAPAGINIAG